MRCATSIERIRLALLVCGGVSLAIGAPASAHEGEIIAARDAVGRLIPVLESNTPLDVPVSVFPGFPGYATGLIGFHSQDFDDVGAGRLALSPNTQIEAILTGGDPGMLIYNGAHAMQPGDRMAFGSPPYDFHPVYHIPVGEPGEVFTLRFVFHDASGLYADSEEFAVAYTPQAPCAGDVDGDGAVDFQDLNLVLTRYGVTYTFFDLNDVLSAYGSGCP